MWQYQQSTGELKCGNAHAGVGYSGTGAGRNNPNLQDMQGVGPIPCGDYTIGKAYDDPHLGPCVMHLDPAPETVTFGRSLFRIHGNNVQNDASHGCIILGPNIRRLVAGSSDKNLTVIS